MLAYTAPCLQAVDDQGRDNILDAYTRPYVLAADYFHQQEDNAKAHMEDYLQQKIESI